MNRRMLLPAALAVCLTLVPAALAAQQELFFDTVDVNVVNVEVVVTDRDGNPVKGLTRDDFEIFEDGEPMAITNFFAAERREPTAPEASADVDLATASGGPETKRLHLVVLIDNFHTWPQNRNLLLANLRPQLATQIAPDGRVMVVTYDGNLEVVQPFTEDPDLVLAALDRVADGVGGHAMVEGELRRLNYQIRSASLRDYSGVGRDPQFEMAVSAAVEISNQLRVVAEQRVQAVRRTVANLRQFCATLAGLPGRKALLYVGDGLPQRAAEALIQEFTDRFDGWMQRNLEYIPEFDARSLEETIQSINSPQFDLMDTIDDLIRDASTERVTFYPISYRGQRGGVVAADTRGSASRLAANLERFNLDSSLIDMAAGTGGVARTSTPNVAGLLDRVVADFTTFYSLGYEAPRSDAVGFRKIEVKVRGEGLKVRHLKGYRTKEPLARVRELTVGALHYDVGANPLEVRLEPGDETPGEGRDRYQVQILVQIPFRRLLLVPQEEHHVGQVTLFVAVRDEKSGGVSEPQRIELPIKIPNERILEAMSGAAAYPLQLNMKKGPKRITVGAHDNLARIDSTTSLEMTVGEGSG